MIWTTSSKCDVSIISPFFGPWSAVSGNRSFFIVLLTLTHTLILLSHLLQKVMVAEQKARRKNERQIFRIIIIKKEWATCQKQSRIYARSK